ncbi:MAG: tRNA 5-methoxyuridine(34)/uridine 5-oxyacetic acid(34) synthase CmoB [Halobacteriovoraceae bacterium]|nr:tRNA 5-methoxyuridine(34)/uridine 5-oxyacetic acid(34) synthase CmoB [Halobacteriovoraceae bacterium]MBT5095674.1 tRNA 5-methoxyuridine(34)/uridine 5-oxyacetic acid(34) synthase CmoB [Halobacteriovoraceae bacterium]
MLDYLSPYSKKCDLPALSKLTEERAKWIERKGQDHLREAFSNLSNFAPSDWKIEDGVVKIGDADQLTAEKMEQLQVHLKKLIPWRKGPFEFFGHSLDAEWRSDLKWDRIAPFLGNLEGKKILDIGCNNGYFMARCLPQKPELILGIDPVNHCKAQFETLQKFMANPAMKFELWGVEEIPHFENFFDVIFSMGIIYHHRHPIQQLLDIRKALVPGGQVILESIGIPGESSTALFPEDRYAKMKNVWFIPTLNCMKNWLHKARFTDVQVISSTKLTTEEQRLTDYCPPPHQSLENFLNPENPELTIEGHPAPYRFSLSARKKPLTH